MRDYYSLIYIAYLSESYDRHHDIILAVSDDKSKIRYYLQEIRKLKKSDYIVREVTMDKDTAWSLYEDYMLQEFSNKYAYLTSRDIAYLGEEIDNEILDWQDLLLGLKHYRNLVNQTKKLPTDVFDQVIGHMDSQLSSVKTIQRLSSAVIANSPVMSPHIWEYLKTMGFMEEDRALTQMFYRKLEEDD